MSVESLLARLMSEQGEVVPPVPPVIHEGVQREPLRHKAVPPVPSVPPQNNNELRRAKVLADLRANPAITYAADVDGTGDPVTIMLAIRDIGTCLLEVDAERWNPFQFLTLMEGSRVTTGAAA